MITPFIVDLLSRIHEKWGPLDPVDVSAFIGQEDHIPATVAEALARAVGRYFNGDFEGAAFTAAARFERIAREILLALGAPVLKIQTRNAPAQYPGLGALLERLDGRGLDESWSRFLGTLLTRPEGPGVRNEMFHGDLDDVPQALAALVIVGALFIATSVRLVTPPSADGEPNLLVVPD
jgi:hypothetical protein